MWIKAYTVLLGIALFIAGMILDFQSHPESENVLKGGLILVILGFLALMTQVNDEEI